MSELLIAGLLMAPVVIVIAILKASRKRKNEKLAEKLAAYRTKITEESGFHSSFQKQLVRQLVLLDERSCRILCIDFSGKSLSHEVHRLDKAGTIAMRRFAQALPLDGKAKRKVNYITETGIDIAFLETGRNLFLTVYDHAKHNFSQMGELEREALDLKERIENVRRFTPAEA